MSDVGIKYQQIFEAANFDKANRTVEVTVIRTGWSKNQVYYPQGVLPQIAEFLNTTARKVYLDHSDKEATATRKMTEWVADVVNARVSGDCIKAIIKVHKSGPNSWIFDRMQESDVNFGPSITGVADVVMGKAEGKNGKIVNNVKYIGSFDIVSSPAAGGSIGSISESVLFPLPEGENKEMRLSEERTREILSGQKLSTAELSRTRQILESGCTKDSEKHTREILGI